MNPFRRTTEAAPPAEPEKITGTEAIRQRAHTRLRRGNFPLTAWDLSC